MISDELMLRFINDSLREAYNQAGDNAWFLRKTVTLTINAPPATTTMPSYVDRIYQLERQDSPGCYLNWTQVLRTDTGDMVILAETGATVIVHYFEVPQDLANEGDPTSFPFEHSELIVVKTMIRMAESVGNMVLQASLLRREERLLNLFKRDCLRYSNMRKGSITLMESRDQWAAML